MSVAREFQTVGAAQQKAQLAKWVLVKGLYSSGAVDERRYGDRKFSEKKSIRMTGSEAVC